VVNVSKNNGQYWEVATLTDTTITASSVIIEDCEKKCHCPSKEQIYKGVECKVKNTNEDLDSLFT
jgi:hypothetical protein